MNDSLFSTILQFSAHTLHLDMTVTFDILSVCSVADREIRLGEEIQQVSQYLTFISLLEEGTKSIPKLDGGRPWPDLPPLRIRH